MRVTVPEPGHIKAKHGLKGHCHLHSAVSALMSLYSRPGLCLLRAKLVSVSA